MILDQFRLRGKVALVTGCSTGLGQGMAYGLAEAGADIVGIDYVDAPETKSYVEDIGRKFLGIKADLSSLEPIEGILRKPSPPLADWISSLTMQGSSGVPTLSNSRKRIGMT